MPLDYEMLRLIWWGLLGLLLIGFAVMDGFDLGAAILLPYVAKTDTERRVVINSIGPVWEGNQVWLVLGAGAIFAAWPALYAAAFSGFYVAMFLVLGALILRPVGFKFRSKIAHPEWRSMWDGLLFVGGLVPAAVFGIAFGNVLQGVPFHLDAQRLPVFEGSFGDLINPLGLLAGAVSVTMLIMHGGAFLAMKTDGEVRERALRHARRGALVALALFALAAPWVAYMHGYAIEGVMDGNGPSDPLLKSVSVGHGAWLNNYCAHPWTLLFPLAGLGGAVAMAGYIRHFSDGLRWLVSALTVAAIVATPGFAIFPFLLPSSTDPGSSLTVWDASSSALTLTVMLVATLIFLPLIIAYTAWVYRVLRGRVTAEQVTGSDQSY